MNKQLTIDFKPSKYAGYSSLRDFIYSRCIPDLLDSSSVYSLKKQIAADMDLSPSLFSRKLSGSKKNPWTSDDTELFMKVTGCNEPAKYMAWIYLNLTDDQKDKEIQSLRRQLQELSK